MARRPKDIGTEAETAASRFCIANGFPKCDRRSLKGAKDRGDLLLCDGVIAEVKVRDRTISLQEIAGWMIETETERINASADYGFLIVRKKFANVAHWPCFWMVKDVVTLHTDFEPDQSGIIKPRTAIASMTLIDSVMMLRHCGYGEVP